MIKIAHRGNTNGPSLLENSPGFLLDAIQKGFDIEVDVRYINNQWYLGHDIPSYPVGDMFMDQIKTNAWIHCKNLEALERLDKTNYKFFWHQNDDFTLTSNGYIWTYPGKNVTSKSIIVDLDLKYNYNNIYGICSDYVNILKQESIQ